VRHKRKYSTIEKDLLEAMMAEIRQKITQTFRAAKVQKRKIEDEGMKDASARLANLDYNMNINLSFNPYSGNGYVKSRYWPEPKLDESLVADKDLWYNPGERGIPDFDLCNICSDRRKIPQIPGILNGGVPCYNCEGMGILALQETPIDKFVLHEEGQPPVNVRIRKPYGCNLKNYLLQLLPAMKIQFHLKQDDPERTEFYTDRGHFIIHHLSNNLYLSFIGLEDFFRQLGYKFQTKFLQLPRQTMTEQPSQRRDFNVYEISWSKITFEGGFTSEQAAHPQEDTCIDFAEN
jgi:hypothetical protein